MRETELAAEILDASPEDVERASASDLVREAREKPVFHLGAVVLLQLFPFLGLRRENEVDDVSGEQAEGPIVVIGPPAPISADLAVAEGRASLAHEGRLVVARVGPVPEQRTLDGFFEAPFGTLWTHNGSVPSLRMAR